MIKQTTLSLEEYRDKVLLPKLKKMGDRVLSIKIETGIVIPEQRYKQTRYPFSVMKIGDSFFVEFAGKKPAVLRGELYNAARRAGMKCTLRTVENGIRAWRIA